MALNAYLTLTGQKSGQIKGSVTEKGRENSILVVAVDHSIISPRDPQSGLPTGKRMHKPFVITKELDKSSPLLYNILTTNENITEFTLRFWTPQVAVASAAGAGVQSFTVKLTNASIASIDFRMADNLMPANAPIPPLEEIAFTYQKIEWTWTDGGISAGDDWEAPVV